MSEELRGPIARRGIITAGLGVAAAIGATMASAGLAHATGGAPLKDCPADVDSYAIAQATSVQADVTVIRVLGYTSPGDGGGASYRRTSSEPTHPGKLQTEDGAWWEITEAVLCPLMFGAQFDEDVDSGPALQDAIDTGHALSLPVQLPIGTLYTGQTLHIYRKSVLVGHGKFQSIIKALADSGQANDQKAVLETYRFMDFTGTTTKYDEDDADLTWGFVLGHLCIDGSRETNYGGVSGDRFGGVGTHMWDGGGIRLYGRAFIVEAIDVRNCAGIGFYSEMGNHTPTSNSYYYNPDNSQQGAIRDVIVGMCSYEGFVYRGPGDIKMDEITTGLCFYPDENYYGDGRTSLMFSTANGNATDELISGFVLADKASNSAVAGCELGLVHSHTTKNGWGIRFQGDVFLRVRCDNLTSEGNLSQIKIRGAVLGQLNKVNVRNNNVGDGSLPEFDFQSTQVLTVSEYECRNSSGNGGSTKLRIGSDRGQWGLITIHGGVAGHGVVIDESVDHVQISQIYAHSLRGTAYDGNSSRALWTKSNSTAIAIGSIQLYDNEVGWRNDTGGYISIANGEIRANKSQYSTIVPLDLATQPSVNALRQCDFVTFDGTTYRSNHFGGTAGIDPTSTAEQTVTFTHNMWRTPTAGEVSASYYTNSTSGNHPTLAALEVGTPTATSVPVLIKFGAAGNGTATGSRLALKI
jgi:hypothetical protein